MSEITEILASSMAEIASRSPVEVLTPTSRYVIAADLRMGDGGKKDELFGAKKALASILGRWYLPRGYSLVLDGDVEDLRRFWLKDIIAAWLDLYALFDIYAEEGRLRKIVGERDLALLRLGSYPYRLLHGLRLDSDGFGSILVFHGHQASPPYAGREYLSDYMVRWLGSAKRHKAPEDRGNGAERYKAERRLYRASARLGIATIQGHTRRPLFESLTNRDSVRAEVERLLRGASSKPYLRSGPGYDALGIASPCLFSPGRVLGARGLRFLEIEGDSIRLARWGRAGRGRSGSAALGLEGEPQVLEGSPYLRYELRSASIRSVLQRIELLAPRAESAAGGCAADGGTI